MIQFRSYFRFTALLFIGAIIATAVANSQETKPRKKPRKAGAKRTVKTSQYKRIHQAALDTITAGQAAEAVAYLEAVVEKMPDDAETQFMLAVARAQTGELDAAVASAEQALKFGLPPARLIAGPRDLLAPLADTPLMQRLVRENPLVHGPLVGSVTDTAASIWVRTAQPCKIVASLSRVQHGPQEVTSSAASAADNDFTAIIKVTDLKPDTAYFYVLRLAAAAGGDPLASGRLRTAPAPGSPTKIRMVFGGGAGFVPQHERMWKTMSAHSPELLLLLGDNVYIDQPTSLHRQRYCYYRRQSRPEFRKLLETVAVYSIWDDHDFGTNDCSGGPAIDDPEWKRPVWKIFTENWANPGYGGGPEQPGCWYTFQRADVQFVMLDGRYYRDHDGSPAPSMLGPVQKAWLKQTLADSQATFKVICSPVPWDFRTKGNSRDTWNGFQEERDEIFSLLARQNIDGVVLMSADRHRSDAWQIERPAGYDLYELNSSRLTNQHVHGEMPAALFSYNKKQSFGLVSFDTTVDDPTVRYDVITIDGEKVHTLELKRSQLTGGRP